MLLLSAILSVAVIDACPKACRCSASGRVYCNGKGLTEVPYGIPVDTQILFLQDNDLENTPELNQFLGQLPQLEKLMLFNNQLAKMPEFYSETLRELNLNGNKIAKISSEAKFYNLDSLNLDDNHLSNEITPLGDFDAMPNLRHISMSENLLVKLPLGLPSSLEHLILTGNKLATFPRESSKRLINLQELRMDKNKLNDQVNDKKHYSSNAQNFKI
jgi:Leucine-rich repeat (LRR) protein